MNSEDQFLSPRCTPQFVDLFVVRSGILSAIREVLPRLQGTVLDVGCGRMPYKSLVLSPPSRVDRYIGLDLYANIYGKPDLEWDGKRIPLDDGSVDCALATEVFEHCQDPEQVMGEALRVLKPGGVMFFTVPFLWPLHDVPHDEYRYTPFALERHLKSVGFSEIKLKALGGWDASMAQMIGLWVRRRPMAPWKRKILSRLALPAVRYLLRRDKPPEEFGESTMITGLSGTAIKPCS